MLQTIFILLTAVVLLAILALFITKAGIQLQYLRLKDGQEAGHKNDYLKFRFSDEKARLERWRAFLLFPMLYPIALNEDREDLNQLKKRVKRIHIGIYLLLIVLIVLSVYSEKVFPT